MVITRPDQYKFSRPDVDRISGSIDGNTMPARDATGAASVVPRWVDLCYLAEMSRERRYLSAYTDPFPQGGTKTAYEVERDYTVPCDLNEIVRTALPIQMVNECISGTGLYPSWRDIRPSGSTKRIRYFGAGDGYNDESGVVDPDVDVFSEKTFPIVVSDPSVPRYYELRECLEFKPTETKPSCIGDSVILRSMYYDLNRMTRFAYGIPNVNQIGGNAKWSDFTGLPDSSPLLQRIVVGPLVSDDGNTTYHPSHIEYDIDDNGNSTPRVVTDPVYSTKGFDQIYIEETYASGDPSVKARSYDTNDGMILAIRPYYSWYGAMSSGSPETWVDGSDIFIGFRFNYTTYGEQEGEPGESGSIGALFAVESGLAAPAKAPLALRSKFQATCKIDADVTGTIMGGVFNLLKGEAVRRCPSLGSRPETMRLFMTDILVLADRTPHATLPDDWEWEPPEN